MDHLLLREEFPDAVRQGGREEQGDLRARFQKISNYFSTRNPYSCSIWPEAVYVRAKYPPGDSASRTFASTGRPGSGAPVQTVPPLESTTSMRATPAASPNERSSSFAVFTVFTSLPRFAILNCSDATGIMRAAPAVQ